LAIISAAWYGASNEALASAVAKTNAQLAATGSRQRALFAKIPFSAEHAFAARNSQLWGFDASFLRKLLVVLSLGKVDLRTNDEIRSLRASMCSDFFKPVPDETDDRKRVRKEQLTTCRLAAIGHPNRKGAVVYAEAIKEQMQTVMRDPGWLRSAAIAGASAQ